MLTRFLPRCLPRCLPSLAARQLSTTPRDFNRQLAGKTAIVTGAAGGIGRGVAELFAEQGANVVVADYNKDAATQVANGLATPSIASFVDVTSEEAVKECMSSAIAEFGQVDILVANAGHQFISPIDEFPLAEWRRMISVHLDGTFLFTREALRHFYAEKVPGKIIMMGSVHSKEASVLKSAYVAAKHAIMGFARAAAKEAGPAGVSVNVVCPGFVLTPLVEKQIPEQAENLGMSEEEVVKNVMLVNTVDKEFATIADVAEACLFLAGHPTNALTGQSITVSHGWNMS